MPDTITPDTESARVALAGMVGDDYAGSLIRGGAQQLEAAFPAGLPPTTTAQEIAGTVLLGALPAFTRGEIQGGLLEGAALAVRDAELAALADTLRVAYRAAESTPHNPLEGLLRLADAAGVDLDGEGPARMPEPCDAEVDALAGVLGQASLDGVEAGSWTLARLVIAAGWRNTAAVPA